MRKMMLLAPVAAACMTVSGCGYSVFDAADDISNISSGGFEGGQPIPAQQSQVAPFEELGALGPDRIVFTTGKQYSIRAEAPADLLAHLRYKMTDGAIQIGRERGDWSDDGTAVIYVTAPSLRSVSAAGSGPIDVDRMTGDDVEISVAGSGALRVADVQAGKLEVNMAGSGKMMLAGEAASSEISVAGSGDIDGSGLQADRSEVSIAGSGDVRLRSDGAVDANIMGSGDVTVTGTAQCNLSSMGSGKLHCGG